VRPPDSQAARQKACMFVKPATAAKQASCFWHHIPSPRANDDSPIRLAELAPRRSALYGYQGASELRHPNKPKGLPWQLQRPSTFYGFQGRDFLLGSRRGGKPRHYSLVVARSLIFRLTAHHHDNSAGWRNILTSRCRLLTLLRRTSSDGRHELHQVLRLLLA
jgi:hypothetical protein